MLLNRQFAATPILDLRISCKLATGGLNTGTFLSSNNTTMAETAKISEEVLKRKLQMMLDKDPIRVSKVGCGIRSTSKIENQHVIIESAANIAVLAVTIAEFDVNRTAFDDMPFFHASARTVAIATSSREYSQYQARYSS